MLNPIFERFGGLQLGYDQNRIIRTETRTLPEFIYTMNFLKFKIQCFPAGFPMNSTSDSGNWTRNSVSRVTRSGMCEIDSRTGIVIGKIRFQVSVLKTTFWSYLPCTNISSPTWKDYISVNLQYNLRWSLPGVKAGLQYKNCKQAHDCSFALFGQFLS